MVGHTPGPWKVVGPAGYIYAEKPYQNHDMHVAQVRGWGHLTGTGGGCAFSEERAIAIQDANARLIAAAPDLLDALKQIEFAMSTLVYTPEVHNAIADTARAAIAKAEDR